jgi:hypothetical protein
VARVEGVTNVRAGMRRWLDRECGRYRANLSQSFGRHEEVLTALLDDPDLTHAAIGKRYRMTVGQIGDIVQRWRLRGINIPSRQRGAAAARLRAATSKNRMKPNATASKS